MENKFNLVDEPWIPLADYGLVSLKDIFLNNCYKSLGGNPIQKIAILKLLLAIAQAAATPKDTEEWQQLGTEGLATQCLAYLEKWYDCFYLYGDRPFLQMPAIAAAEIKSFGVLLPEISTGNTTLLHSSQVEREMSYPEQALILLTQMGFALSGKKTDNSIVLTPNYRAKQNDKGKASSGKPGPSVGHLGFLHNFVLGQNLQETLYLNLFTHQALEKTNLFSQGVGVAPWEKMPTGEACQVAQNLQHTYMGRLIPMNRFCLLAEQGIHYSEGILYSNYKEGVYDLSIAVNFAGKEPRALWCDTEKKPWRELVSLLSFINATKSQGFQSLQLTYAIQNAQQLHCEFSIYSGGLRVSSNAGEQYVSGSDDMVESSVLMDAEAIGEIWFIQLTQEMKGLEDLAKTLYGRVIAYFKDLTVEGGKVAAQATHLFWQLCERNFQELVQNCGHQEEQDVIHKKLRPIFASYQSQAFDTFCPKTTARQIDAWAKNRPNPIKYLNKKAG